MNKPVDPPKQPETDTWIPIGKAASEVMRKLAEQRGSK